MNNDNIVYLIFDKRINGIHHFDNNILNTISVSSLFNSNIIPLKGIYAINEFNNLCTHVFSDNITVNTIPLDLDLNIYNVYFFINTINNIITYTTLISINTELFKKYIIEYNIPNHNFIKLVCIYHIFYHEILNVQSNNNIIIKKEISLNEYLIQSKMDELFKKSQNCNTDISDPIIESPSFMNFPLFNYQKRTIKWMLDIEHNLNVVSFSFNNKLILNDIIFDNTIKQFLCNDLYNMTFKGGVLMDEVGLGKTIQILTLSLLNKPSNINYYQIPNELSSRATLIICPDHLCIQWSNEIKKMIKNCDLSIITLLTKVNYKKINYIDLLDADFVIISFGFLKNKCHLDNFDSNDFNNISNILNIKKNKLLKSPVLLFEKNIILFLIYWHRIIIDEFHELNTVDKYAYMNNFIYLLNSKYKWCVTGTPFNVHKNCLINMINFIINYNIINNNYIINDNYIINYNNKQTTMDIIKNNMKVHHLLCDDIYDYISNNFFRRNTKQSINNEYKLEPYNEQIILLKFTPTERMIYNAYLVNHTIDKDSILLRQLCCHPSIANEIKNIISNCKTPAEMGIIMLNHYKNEMNTSNSQLKSIELNIIKCSYLLTCATFKQQKQLLIKLGYNVTIEFPPLPLNILFDNDDINIINDDINIDDDDKPKFIISIYTQIDVMNLITIEISNLNIKTLNNNLKTFQIKLNKEKINYEGKLSTYSFFNTTMERLRKMNESKIDDDICSICLGSIDCDDIGITNCGHIYCFQCLHQMISKINKCPLCCKIITISNIYRISYEKPFKKNNKNNLDKLTLINTVGTKLANLIIYIQSIKDKCVIFSQWDNLLQKVGTVLTDYNINNVFCKGNIHMKNKAIRDFTNNDDIRVIMLSSDRAASGTNLTIASTIILLDPVCGSYEYRYNTEWQAIGRVYRMGQTNKVSVVRMIIKDSIEEDIYNANKIENKIENKKHISHTNISEFNDDSIIINNDQLNITTSSKSSKSSKYEKKNISSSDEESRDDSSLDDVLSDDDINILNNIINIKKNIKRDDDDFSLDDDINIKKDVINNKKNIKRDDDDSSDN